MLIPIDVDRIRSTFHSRQWSFECSETALSDATCIAELARRLPHIDPSSWAERFKLGGVYLNGREATPETILSPPYRLQYFEPLDPLPLVGKRYPEFSPRFIVHEDEDLAVVFKPPGLPSTAPRDQRLYTMQRYLDDHFGRPVHLPSRLDAAVAGIIPVSLSPRMNRCLQRAYVNRSVEKYYLAEVDGVFPESREVLVSPIARDERHPILRRVTQEGGDDARTVVRVLGSLAGGQRAILQVQPVTGRTHQIRVHLAYKGFPIVGDPFYGGSESTEIRLVCYELRFFHPFLGRALSIELPPALWSSWLRAAHEELGVLRLTQE